jgi:hypothetical protein
MSPWRSDETLSLAYYRKDHPDRYTTSSLELRMNATIKLLNTVFSDSVIHER